MKIARDDWLILLVGGPLFGVLAHWRFDDAPGPALSIAVGIVVMALIVGLRRLVGDRSWLGFFGSRLLRWSDHRFGRVVAHRSQPSVDLLRPSERPFHADRLHH